MSEYFLTAVIENEKKNQTRSVIFKYFTTSFVQYTFACLEKEIFLL